MRVTRSGGFNRMDFEVLVDRLSDEQTCKSHLAAAIAWPLIESGGGCCSCATELVQKLQVARRELQLESTIAKPDDFGSSLMISPT